MRPIPGLFWAVLFFYLYITTIEAISSNFRLLTFTHTYTRKVPKPEANYAIFCERILLTNERSDDCGTAAN